jgi:ATP-dependent DNA helicase PIF1
MSLSPEQQFAVDAFHRGENLFITGPGGTGKTRLIKHILSCGGVGSSIQVCAMTGCAAILLECGARTLHSWSGIKLAKGPPDTIVANALRNKTAVASWRKTKVLIVDEVSMMSRKIFDICNEIAKRARNCTLPFGGIQVIFTGDFYQLPPVGNFGEPDTEEFCFESNNWFSVFKLENHIQLKTIFRQSDPVYIDILSEIRTGKLSEKNLSILTERVGRAYNPSENNGCILTKLFPTRVKADFVNQAQYAKIESEEKIMKCIRNKSALAYVENGAVIEPEILLKCSHLSDAEKDHQLEMLIANTNCIETLKLKKGTAVMCTANIDLESGICNGSQGVIVDFFANDPVVLFSNGIRKIITKHEWQSDEYPILTIAQYPLCMAWALTIHKIQGATMAMAEMDLGNSVFEYGQTYVALSRIKSLDGLYLSAFKADKIKANPKVTKFYQAIPVVEYSKIMEKSNGDTKPIDFDRFAYKEPEATRPNVKLIHIATPSSDVTSGGPILKVQKCKKTTDKISLEMFMEGKSIDEIAMTRRIKPETVMEHLLSNMPNEAITYDKFMNTETYDYIKDAYHVLGSDSSLKVIKDHLPRYVSYTQIKVVRNLLFPTSIVV